MTDLNEEAEAAGEDDLAAGRMVNRGRVALLSAIRNMSKAAGALTAVDVAAALAFEQSALKQLEAAFSHSRIILRALADHERLDPTRRLGGSLSDARSFAQAAVVPAYSADVRGAINELEQEVASPTEELKSIREIGSDIRSIGDQTRDAAANDRPNGTS